MNVSLLTSFHQPCLPVEQAGIPLKPLASWPFRGILAFAKLTSALLLTFLAGCGSGPDKDTTGTNSTDKLNALYEDYRQFCMRNYPEWATYEGDHRYSDRLTDWRPEAFAARMDSLRSFLQRAEQTDSAALSPGDHLNRDLFIREMDLALEALAFRPEYQPFGQQSGPHIDFPQIVEIQPLEKPSDFAAYFKRLERFPELLIACETNARQGIAAGQVPPRILIEQVLQQCQTMASYTVEGSPFYRPLIGRKETFGSEYDALDAELRRLIQTAIQPAYQRLTAFLESEYLPACREEPGISALPDGAARYAYAVKSHTTLSLTPDQIFAIGMEEVAAIQTQMEGIKTQTGFNGTLDEFLAYLRTDPQFYYTDKAPMMAEYRAILDKMDASLPTLFGRLPQAPYGLKEIEEYRAASAPQAYYYSAPEDGSRPGYFYVNTTRLEARPKYTMTALALHEAVPGHHLQIAIAQELEEMPWFRRNISSTAFVEGWGLYAESLGFEAGLYDDPYQHFGALAFSMWRACRLVVDVGLHHKGWSREEAVTFMLDHTANSEADVRSEVDRYIAWPGQALAYKIGERKIMELRRRAEAEMGAQFDVKTFHDRLLEQGPLPLPLLEERMNAWMLAARDDAS